VVHGAAGEGAVEKGRDWRRGHRGLDKYGLAAAAILEADVLIIAAGAGMSQVI
jgi:hypothetical protein